MRILKTSPIVCLQHFTNNLARKIVISACALLECASFYSTTISTIYYNVWLYSALILRQTSWIKFSRLKSKPFLLSLRNVFVRGGRTKCGWGVLLRSWNPLPVSDQKKLFNFLLRSHRVNLYAQSSTRSLN